MKRSICTLLAVVFFFSLFPLKCDAVEVTEPKNVVTYYADGSYSIEEISAVETRASGTKTGTKTNSHYSSAGVLEWKAVLTGTFSYTGSSATCTSSSCDVTVYNSAWYTISKSAGKSGSSATAAVTMGKKLLGVTVDQRSVNLKLTCDANGNLS